MDIKNATVDGRLVDVLSEDQYSERWRMYSNNPGLYNDTALEVKRGDETYILPFRGKLDDRPGIYNLGAMYYMRFPTEEDDANYNEKNLNIVDYSDISTVQDFLDKNAQVRNMENIILTDIDSVFTPPMLPDDSPEMRAFKTAIASKHCDINKYAPRFGDNYLNDKRILKTNSITMNKMISISKNMDIEVELILRNPTDREIANPMDREIRVVLTGGADNE